MNFFIIPFRLLICSLIIIIFSISVQAQFSYKDQINQGVSAFNYPMGIIVDSKGHIYVADSQNNIIHKFDGSVWTAISIPGQFINPSGLALDNQGNLFVADTYHGIIQKYDGISWAVIGKEGSGTGEFRMPTDLVFDSQGNLYVAEWSNHRIQKFDGQTWSIMGMEGSEIGQFKNPLGITIDGEGHIYVADNGNHRIQKFDGINWTTMGSYGSGKGEFSFPSGVAVDKHQNLYVAEKGNNRIQKYDGINWFTYGSKGSNDGQFENPEDLTLDSNDNLYVADAANNRIQILSVSSIALPEISIKVNDTEIANKTGSYSFKKTTFGNPLTQTFTIDNSAGSSDLIVSEPLLPTGFSLSSKFPSNIAAGQSATFIVNLLASEVGLKTGKVCISNNDANENPYCFEINGTVEKAPQAVSFDSIPDKLVSDLPFKLSARANSGLPITYSILAGPATISGDTLAFTRSGEITVKASQAGNENYLPAPEVNRYFIVKKAPQVISFDSIPDKQVGDAPFTLTATASSGLPVIFTVSAGPVTITGNQLTIIRSGEITVKASQAGNENYLPAPDISQFFMVHPVLAIESDTNSGIIVYPNPVTDAILINFPRPVKNGSLTLLNSTGQTVLYQELNGEINKKLNVKHLPSGIYFLLGNYQDRQFSTKVVID